MNSNNVLSNFIWRLLERCGAQVVSLVVSIILARMLSPDDYGLVALMTVFISVLGVFIDSGFSTALVQKKDTDDLDYSTIFVFNIISSIGIYSALFVFSSHIANFYGKPELIAMIRVLGLTLVISGVKGIQIAYVSRNMLFKKFFFATLGGTIGAAIVGILMAYVGFGAWALIVQSLFNNLVDTIILWCTVNCRPKIKFKKERFYQLFSYSWKLLVSGLLDTVYNNLNQLIIGRLYSSNDLAYYNRGMSWPNLIITNVNTSIDSVLLPSLSREQNNKMKIKQMTKKAIKLSTYIMFPLMIGLAICGTPLIRLVLTEKWLPAVPFQVIFCFIFMLYPIHTANLNSIKAVGRSDIFLKLEIIKKIFGIIAILFAVRISVLAMAYSLLATAFFSQIVNTLPNKKLINYGYFSQIKDIFPNLAISFLMGVIIYPIKFWGLPDALTLVIMFVVGVVVYLLGSLILHVDSFYYILERMREYAIQK